MKKLLKPIGTVLMLLSLAYLVRAVLRLGLDFSSVTDWPGFFFIILLSTVQKLASVTLTGIVWSGWISFFSRKRCSIRASLSVYARANIGKYLPGNVMHYVERNLYAAEMGVTQVCAALSTVLEPVTLILSSAALALLLAREQMMTAVDAVLARVGLSLSAPLICCAALALVILCLIAFFLLRKRFAVIREYRPADFGFRLVCALLGNAASLLLLGSAFAFLYLQMGGTGGMPMAAALTGIFVIAWVLGFVVPGAPGGIGIREFVLTLLGTPLIGAETVLTVALIHRLITIIGDFLFYLIGILFLSKREKRTEISPEEQNV